MVDSGFYKRKIQATERQIEALIIKKRYYQDKLHKAYEKQRVSDMRYKSKCRLIKIKKE